VLAEAEDLNQPLLHRAVSVAAEAEWAAVRVRGLTLGLSGFKRGEEDGLILRLYEPAGARGCAGIDLPEGWRLEGAVDLLERPAGAPDTAFRPFQLRSWRLVRAEEGRGPA
jgi:alpha-mannosidase